ncbi:MAG: HNH endonuclease [Polyangiaceae bacterium]|nr:HNH endonuclease [Polyangiaceae bacterium]NUQ79213.1 HNH endonuclease [Polyangiaceae bacterium]
MDPRQDLAQSALRLAERLIQLLDRGGFTATYKYAVLVALMDLCMELTGATGLPPDVITTRQLAEKVIELYWLHCAPYDGERGVLRQNIGKSGSQAEIIQHILQFRRSVDANPAASLPLSRARAAASPGAFERLVRIVEWKLIEMPLSRLQLIGRQEDRFLYEYAFTKDVQKKIVSQYQEGDDGTFDNRLLLKPGVSAALLALNGVLRPLVHRQWAMLVAEMNGLKESPLEEFLFGADRISLDPLRPKLRALQENRCFYCGRAIRGPSHVDHFIPWSRHFDNSIDNLVVTHDDCNLEKRDFLAAADHVERWRERSRRDAAALAYIARETSWESRPTRTFSVARAIYLMLPDDARLWQSGRSFVKIELPRIIAVLAA